jgi:hypothetical protein
MGSPVAEAPRHTIKAPTPPCSLELTGERTWIRSKPFFDAADYVLFRSSILIAGLGVLGLAAYGAWKLFW